MHKICIANKTYLVFWRTAKLTELC